MSLHGKQIKSNTISLDKLNINSYTVGDPISGVSLPKSLVNKEYVDQIAAGLSPKESVKVATTSSDGNLDLLTGGLLNIDTVVLSEGDRVLVKNQTNLTENGVYIASSGQWIRSNDFDGNPGGSGEIQRGDYIFVTNGVVNKAIGFIVISNGSLTGDNGLEHSVGVDDIVFTEISEAIDYFGGNGILITGAEISILLDPSGGLDFTTGLLGVANNGITESMINFGSNPGQIDASSILLDINGNYSGSSTNVQNALEEIENNLLSLSLTDGSGITVSGLTPNLGGILNQNTLITGAGLYNLEFGMAGDQINNFFVSSNSLFLEAGDGIQNFVFGSLEMDSFSGLNIVVVDNFDYSGYTLSISNSNITISYDYGAYELRMEDQFISMRSAGGIGQFLISQFDEAIIDAFSVSINVEGTTRFLFDIGSAFYTDPNFPGSYTGIQYLEDYTFDSGATNLTLATKGYVDDLAGKQYEEISYVDLRNLSDNNLLVVNKNYLITSSTQRTHPNTRGKILVTALSTNQLDAKASYISESPNYNTAFVWQANTIQDKVIWQSETWQYSGTGLKSEEPSDISTAWTKIPNESNEIDFILYDFENDRINYRRDKRGNEVDWAGKWESEIVPINSGDLEGTPSALVVNSDLRTEPNYTAIDKEEAFVVVYDDVNGKYYGLQLQGASATVPNGATNVRLPMSFLIMDFGDSLDNTPTYTKTGDLPELDGMAGQRGFEVVKNNRGEWVGFFGRINTSSFTPTNNFLIKFNWGTDITSTPTITKYYAADLGIEENHLILGVAIAIEDGDIMVRLNGLLNRVAGSYTPIPNETVSAIVNFGQNADSVKETYLYTINYPFFGGRKAKFIKEKDNWLLLITGTSDQNNSSLHNVVHLWDYGNSLKNEPTITDRSVDVDIFSVGYEGGGYHEIPQKTHIFKDGDNYIALWLRPETGVLLRADFGYSLYNTPTITNLGKLGLTFPSSWVWSQTSFSIDKLGGVNDVYLFAVSRETSSSTPKLIRYKFPEGMLSTAKPEDFYTDTFYNSIERFRWNDDQVNDNRLEGDSFVDIADAFALILRDNLFESGSRFFNNAISGESTIIQKNVFNNAVVRDNNLDNVKLLDNVFSGFDFKDQILQDVAIQNLRISQGFSNFWVTLDITGQTTIDLTNLSHIGRVVITSSNPTETISQIIQDNDNHPLLIEPQVGLTVTFVHNNPLRLPNEQNLTIYGDLLEFVSFKKSKILTGRWLYDYSNSIVNASESITIPYTDFVDSGYYKSGSNIVITRMGRMICIELYLIRNNVVVTPMRDLVFANDIRTIIPASWATPKIIGLFIENNSDRSVALGVDYNYIFRDFYGATANYTNTTFFGQTIYFIN